MENKELLFDAKKLSYKRKEEFLSFLLILEKQEKQDNQVPAFASLQKDD